MILLAISYKVAFPAYGKNVKVSFEIGLLNLH